MTSAPIVAREECPAHRATLLTLEKEPTRAGDELARRHRELPWVEIEKRYARRPTPGSDC